MLASARWAVPSMHSLTNELWPWVIFAHYSEGTRADIKNSLHFARRGERGGRGWLVQTRWRMWTLYMFLISLFKCFVCVWNCRRPRVITKRRIFGFRKWFAGVYIGTLFVLLASHAASSKFSLSRWKILLYWVKQIKNWNVNFWINSVLLKVNYFDKWN